MKKSTMKKNAEAKKTAKCPRLTKEERAARDQKLKEERAAKKAASLAKREAKKQKEADRKAALKLKREERKAKKMARLQKEKERKAALKLKAKERAEAKKAREAARAEKKIAREAKSKKTIEKKPRAKKVDAVKKVSAEEKLEYERNEWKALSAIRRYVKDEAKAVGALDGDKLDRKLKKLEKMGYEVLRGPDGKLLSVGYSFKADIKLGKVANDDGSKKLKKEKKPRKPRAKKVEEEVQQPQVSDGTTAKEPSLEELAKSEDVELISDEEILKIADAEKNGGSVDTVLVGDAFQDETEIAGAAEALENDDDLDEDDDLANPDGDPDSDSELNEKNDDDYFGEGGNISKEQEDYRHEYFNNGEMNGDWD